MAVLGFDVFSKRIASRLLAQVRRQGYATGDREYQRTTRTPTTPGCKALRAPSMTC